ncbi:MAG: ParA family protein [Pseudomonadota bacterium]
MYTISVANQKGGCGKTTTAVNLSACLSMKGYRVLLVDADPQAQASTCLRIEDREPRGTIFDAILETRKGARSFADMLVPISSGLTLLPSEGISMDDEARLNSQPQRSLKLAPLLGSVKNQYDFAVIDCPPTLGVLTQNALLASNAVLLTVETSFLALHGVGKLLSLIQDVRKEHAIRMFAVATMFDGRTSFAREVLEDMRGYFDNVMLSTVIRENVRLKEAASHGMPIFTYAHASNGAEDYRALTDEILAKVVQGIQEMKKLVPMATRGA